MGGEGLADHHQRGEDQGEPDRRTSGKGAGVDPQPDGDQEGRDEEGGTEEFDPLHQLTVPGDQPVDPDAGQEGADQPFDAPEDADEGATRHAAEGPDEPLDAGPADVDEEPVGCSGQQPQTEPGEEDDPGPDRHHGHVFTPGGSCAWCG